VSEAASNNAWCNIELVSDTRGRTIGESVSATVVNGDRFVYTLSGGVVYESATNNFWRSLRLIVDVGRGNGLSAGGRCLVGRDEHLATEDPPHRRAPQICAHHAAAYFYQRVLNRVWQKAGDHPVGGEA
jgi:hypothetical protein